MDGWTIAFLVTTAILTIRTLNKMVKRDRVLPRFLLWRRLRRRGHAWYHPEVVTGLIKRRAGTTELDRWFRGTNNR